MRDRIYWPREKKKKVPYIPIGVPATANPMFEIQLVTKQLPNLTQSHEGYGLAGCEATLFGKVVTTFYVTHTLHFLMFSMSAKKCKVQIIKYSL
jgi:hypothetical protein